MYTRVRVHYPTLGGGCHPPPTTATISPKRARVGHASAPNLCRLLPLVRIGLLACCSIEIEDARRVVLVLRAQRARQLVVAVGLRFLALLLQRAAQRVVRIVICGRKVEHRAKLLLRLLVALDSQIGDAECLADRRLVRLPPLRLLERDRRLRRPSLAQVGASLLEEVVGLAHVDLKYGKFSSTKSSGSVKSRVFPISIDITVSPASIADWKAFSSSYGGRSRQRRSATASASVQRGAPDQGFAGSSSRMRSTRPSLLRTALRPGAGGGETRTATAPAASASLNSFAKRPMSPGEKTVSAADTSRGRLAPASTARRTASAEPST